ncbi:MAG: alpha/beta hydrolase [Nocardioidaceae bacterium]|nr:alpha/beta hydrolase [Nocardioidaceae bacterium]
MQITSELVHVRAGSGEPVVLIHGIGHRKEAWEPIFERLAESHDVIALDLAGFGSSAPYPRGTHYDMDNACAHLAANFERWGLQRPHVVGNSLGGGIALELAARGLVSSATALSPAGFFGRVDRFQALVPLLFMWLTSHVPDAALKAIARSGLGRRMIGFMLYAHPERASAEATYRDARALRDGAGFLPTLRSGVRYSFTAQPQVPVTVAWGTGDRLLPYRQASTARQRLPQATHIALHDAGHVPMLDVPDRICELVEETIIRGREEGAA